ncbi:MAG: hypothetical protein F6K30_27090, partial [Cyanothece sp. SIO2G6]|nr:hypothetical protein [Cyanothece sp. SIO2G6]
MAAPSSTRFYYLRWCLLIGVGLILSVGLHMGWQLCSVKALGSTVPPADAPILAQTTAPLPHILVQSAKTLYDNQRYIDASQQLREAAASYAVLGDRPSQAQTLALQSLALQKLGDWHNAQALLDESFALLNMIANPPVRIRAQIWNAQGHLYLAIGQTQAALISWENAEQDYLAADELAGAIGSQINQVQALESLGTYHRAAKILAEIETHLSEMPDSDIKVKGLLKLGNTLRLQGDLQRSQVQLKAGLDLAYSLNLSQLLSPLYLSLGNTEQILMARAMAFNLSDSLSDNLADANIPDAGQNHWQAALAFYQQAITTAPSLLNRVEAQLNQLRLLI